MMIVIIILQHPKILRQGGHSWRRVCLGKKKYSDIWVMGRVVSKLIRQRWLEPAWDPRTKIRWGICWYRLVNNYSGITGPLTDLIKREHQVWWNRHSHSNDPLLVQKLLFVEAFSCIRLTFAPSILCCFPGGFLRQVVKGRVIRGGEGRGVPSAAQQNKKVSCTCFMDSL